MLQLVSKRLPAAIGCKARGSALSVKKVLDVLQHASEPFSPPALTSNFSPKFALKPAWFTRVCIWVAVPLACFPARARAQRSGTRNRNRECRKADYEHDYEYDSCVESCNPELNQASKPVTREQTKTHTQFASCCGRSPARGTVKIPSNLSLRNYRVLPPMLKSAC